MSEDRKAQPVDGHDGEPEGLMADAVADASSGSEELNVEEKFRPSVVEGGADASPAAPAAVKTARFAPLIGGGGIGEQGSMNLLMDVQLDLSVELGRTSILVRDVLQLGPGSILELEKLSGEPVDVLVNGKMVARGEVVVVDENFGVRVTEIINRPDGALEAA